MDHNQSRRRFIGNILTMAGGSAAPFALNLAAMGQAAAETATDYKALICLYMGGGNDHFNTLLATDSESWNAYSTIRTTKDSGSIALPGVGAVNGVLPITPSGNANPGRSFALHPELKPIKALFEQGRAAIVANVGTLIQPTTRLQYRAGSNLPPKLFSHNDQQSLWQSYKPEGAAFGWGGRMGDMLAASNSHANFTCISAAGNAVFLTGRDVRQYQVGAAGAVPIRTLNNMLFNSPAQSNTLQQVITAGGTTNIGKEHAAVVSRSIAAQSLLSGAILAAGSGGVPDPTRYVNPNTGLLATNPLAVQLQTVARIIGGRGGLGAKRQVFYVNLSGFDTHDNERARHGDLMAKLAHALAYFDAALAALQGTDMRRQVTLFTASDFGRTFASNGDGSDHGWGSHHFVIGGAVKGGDIYGAVPPIGLNHDYDVSSGSLLPTFSVDQYGATLATWFGLSASQLTDVFPNLGNFSTRNLGFMSAA